MRLCSLVCSLALVHLLVGSFLTSPRPSSAATPLSVVHTVNDLWNSLATSAAKETVKAVKKTANLDMELEGVPMDTFQVLVGRQHHIGLEVEGVTYDLLLGNEAEAIEEARKRTAAAAAAAAAAVTVALPVSAASSALTPVAANRGLAFARGPDGLLAPLQLFSGPRSSRTLELPETALTGPLELVLREPEPVAIYSPLAADVGGPVRRVVLDAGVTVRVAGLQRVALRRPVDLPRLPGQYLAEVYAQSITGEAEEGFDHAPGILYIASQLRKAAMEAANSSKPGRSSPSQLLSLEVETVAHGSLTISSASDLPPEVATGAAATAPRLKVRRQPGSTVELSLRQGQVSPADDSFNPAALARTWAWPMPYVGSSSWLPYETLLRSVLASHPFNIDSVIRRGIGMRLTKSSIQGVHMIAFDMEVRARQPRPPELEDSPFQWNETPLEVWEAVVQVQSAKEAEGGAATGSSASSSSSSSSSGAAAGSSSGYRFVPLHVKRKQSYQNTLTLSRSAMVMAFNGGRNGTAGATPYGYDQMDLGIAANAP